MDRVDEQGLYWYVCMNPQCSKYRVSWNPSSAVETPATIQPKQFVEEVNTEPKNIPDIVDAE